LDDVEGWGRRLAVDARVASDVCAPRLTKGWAGRHEDGAKARLLTLDKQQEQRFES
jgi:hypothetical protein